MTVTGGRGPLRRALRDRMAARAGLTLPALPELTIEVGGLPRTYAFVPGQQPLAPLLLVLHGAGGTGLGMAALTRLAERAPGSGFAAAFPDGWGRVWNDRRGAPRLARRERVDDAAFLAALVARLAADGVADPSRVVAVGMSNGAFLSEQVARHEVLPLAGIALVAGGATQTSRELRPSPPGGIPVLLVHGTADPLVPYAGGVIGFHGPFAERRVAAGRGVAAPAEAVAADWAAANGHRGRPSVEQVTAGAFPATHLSWRGDGPPVSLVRVEGAGHTWPGGAQYLPARIVGPVATDLDCTGTILDFF